MNTGSSNIIDDMVAGLTKKTRSIPPYHPAARIISHLNQRLMNMCISKSERIGSLE
jgi:hypothetical protein